MPLLRLLGPVVTVVADGADQLFFGNFLYSRVKVVDEPVLRCHGAGSSSGKMLVVVHDDDAIHGCGNRFVIEVLVTNLNACVELHSLGVEVGREFVQQSYVSYLTSFREGLEINHQAAIVIGREKKGDFAAKPGASLRIVKEIGNGGNKVGSVEVLHDWKDFHVGVFSF